MRRAWTREPGVPSGPPSPTTSTASASARQERAPPLEQGPGLGRAAGEDGPAHVGVRSEEDPQPARLGMPAHSSRRSPPRHQRASRSGSVTGVPRSPRRWVSVTRRHRAAHPRPRSVPAPRPRARTVTRGRRGSTTAPPRTGARTLGARAPRHRRLPHGEVDAEDRGDAGPATGHREPHRAVEAVAVGEGEGVLAVLGGPLDEVLRGRGAEAHREAGGDVEVDEVGVAHAVSRAAARRRTARSARGMPRVMVTSSTKVSAARSRSSASRTGPDRRGPVASELGRGLELLAAHRREREDLGPLGELRGLARRAAARGPAGPRAARVPATRAAAARIAASWEVTRRAAASSAAYASARHCRDCSRRARAGPAPTALSPGPGAGPTGRCSRRRRRRRGRRRRCRRRCRPRPATRAARDARRGHRGRATTTGARSSRRGPHGRRGCGRARRTRGGGAGRRATPSAAGSAGLDPDLDGFFVPAHHDMASSGQDGMRVGSSRSPIVRTSVRTPPLYNRRTAAPSSPYADAMSRARRPRLASGPQRRTPRSPPC